MCPCIGSLPARPARDHEPRFLEDAQVLHDPEASHLQLRFELGERAAVTRKKPVEQKSSSRVGERFEDAIVVCHGRCSVTKWSRAKKNALVESKNPKWQDLAATWYAA